MMSPRAPCILIEETLSDRVTHTHTHSLTLSHTCLSLSFRRLEGGIYTPSPLVCPPPPPPNIVWAAMAKLLTGQIDGSLGAEANS